MKLKFYLIIAGVVILAGLTVYINAVIVQNRKLKVENARLTGNQAELLGRVAQYQKLNLTYKEIVAKKVLALDSLAKLLKIKPKEIIKVVEKIITQEDTSKHQATVTPVISPTGNPLKNTWQISDSGKCYLWQGVARLAGDSLNVTKTLFSYHNKIDDVFWQKRKYNFLFLHFGKKTVYQQSTSECGNSVTREVNIIKK
jgi:hypothetical protein